jgi:hypothetical protein
MLTGILRYCTVYSWGLAVKIIFGTVTGYRYPNETNAVESKMAHLNRLFKVGDLNLKMSK